MTIGGRVGASPLKKLVLDVARSIDPRGGRTSCPDPDHAYIVRLLGRAHWHIYELKQQLAEAGIEPKEPPSELDLSAYRDLARPEDRQT